MSHNAPLGSSGHTQRCGITPSITFSHRRSERALADVRDVDDGILSQQQAPREGLVVVPQRRGLDDGAALISLGPGQREGHSLVTSRDDPSGND